MGLPESGPLDEEVLSRIQIQLERLEQFEGVEFVPSYPNFRNIAAHHLPTVYPDHVTEARLDVRWHGGGDYSVHYVEAWTDGTRWECRWDRHPEDVGRAHFHPPPDAGPPEPTDLPTDYRDVIALVLAYTSERIERIRELSES